MPSDVVKQLIAQFRASFQGEAEFDLPISLRQESPDIVFKALLEDDENPMPPVTPLIGYDLGASDMPMDMSQSDFAGDLLETAGIPPEALGGLGAAPMGPDPLAGAGAPQAAPQPLPQGAPQPGPAPVSGGNPLEDLMGLI